MKRFLLLSLLCISISSTAQTITWTGAVDVNFNNAANWSPPQVPTANHDVVIPTASVMTVNVASSVLSIDILGTAMVTMSNNFTFTAPSTVGTDAVVTWTNGTINGGSTLTNNGVFNLTTSSAKPIIGLTTFNNEGTFNINSVGDLHITDGIFNNQLAGIIDMRNDVGNISWGGGSASRILNNFGTIKRTTSSGTASISIFLNNLGGTISVESGILTFDNLAKTLTDGTFNVVSGSTLNLITNTDISGTLTGTLDGTLDWSTTVMAATNATFDFTGSNELKWSSGTLTGGGTLVAKSPINLTTSASKSIIGFTTLNNESDFNITSGGDLLISDGIFNNQPTGVIDMRVDSGNITYSGTASRVLNNFGLIKKSAGAGLTTILVQTTNSGTIDVMTGELEFTDPLGLTNTTTGIIKGVSKIDLPAAANFVNDGTFAPGASPGTLNVIGGFESTATSVLDIELNGTVQGTEYDLLAISGAAIMDGTVNVTMGYDGVLAQEFVVATTAGMISSCTLAPTATSDYSGKRYDFSVECRTDNEVVLTIMLITDIQNPTAITQDINAFLDATGVATIAPGNVNSGSNDNCTIPENLLLSLDTNSWNCSQLGPHTVTLTVEDEVGLTHAATAIVTVVAPTTTFTGGVWTPNAPHLGSTAVVNDFYFTSVDGMIDSCVCEITPIGFLIVNGGTWVRCSRDFTVRGPLVIESEGIVIVGMH